MSWHAAALPFACAPDQIWLFMADYPLIEEFLDAGINVALGTDSLASSPSLNLFEEMAFVADNYPGLRPEVDPRHGIYQWSDGAEKVRPRHYQAWSNSTTYLCRA